jgi:hypothetical protein
MHRRRLLIQPLLLVLAASLGAASAAAHGGGLPWIWLEEEQVRQGEEFNVVVVDYAAYGTVRFELVGTGARAELGTIVCEGDGHGEGSLPVPASFPDGYAELIGRDNEGGEAVTLLYVGDVSGAGPPPPVRPAPGSADPPNAALADPSVLVLGLLVTGAAAALVLMILRRPRAPRGGIEQR